MIGHIIGIDSAGHTVGPFHNELERKIKDTNRILEQIIEKMDKHTTLIVFGDHGGSSELELRTIFFAY